jgi:hypothetical protein
VDLLDVGRGERLVDHPDHRHHPAHRRLEAQLHLVLASRLVELLAVVREELLVGAHHVAPRAHGPQDVLARRLKPAHELHHQVAALEDLVEVALARGEHAGDLGPAPDLRLDGTRPLLEELVEGRPDRSVAEEADPKRRHAA